MRKSRIFSRQGTLCSSTWDGSAKKITLRAALGRSLRFPHDIRQRLGRILRRTATKKKRLKINASIDTFQLWYLPWPELQHNQNTRSRTIPLRLLRAHVYRKLDLSKDAFLRKVGWSEWRPTLYPEKRSQESATVEIRAWLYSALCPHGGGGKKETPIQKLWREDCKKGWQKR